MDIEGAEMEMLTTADPTRHRAIGQITVGFHGDSVLGFGMYREVGRAIQRLGRLGFVALNFLRPLRSATVRLLLDTLRPMGEWWREQAFFVYMNFASPKRVHTFEHERYRQKSKIYHCIFTTDKRRVDMYYLLRYGRTIGDRFRVGGIWGVLLIQRLRKKMQVRTRMYRWLRLDVFL